MRIRPNSSILEATVLGLRRCNDGVGAELDLQVHRCVPQAPAEDFIGAEPGQHITAFVAVPEAVCVGDCLRFDATVLGGPRGERVVVSQPRPLPQKHALAQTPTNTPKRPA
jgi:hypothetical protein